MILSGWWFQPLWKIWVNGKEYPIYYGKWKSCSKPPTSYRYNCLDHPSKRDKWVIYLLWLGNFHGQNDYIWCGFSYLLGCIHMVCNVVKPKAQVFVGDRVLSYPLYPTARDWLADFDTTQGKRHLPNFLKGARHTKKRCRVVFASQQVVNIDWGWWGHDS